jgi:hypothetical protein
LLTAFETSGHVLVDPISRGSTFIGGIESADSIGCQSSRRRFETCSPRRRATHAHFDHLLDAPEIMRARMLDSSPTNRIRLVESFEFRLTNVKSSNKGAYAPGCGPRACGATRPAERFR